MSVAGPVATSRAIKSRMDRGASPERAPRGLGRVWSMSRGAWHAAPHCLKEPPMNPVRRFVLTVALSTFTVLGGAATARAASNPGTCTNDIDCIATPECGGDVCDYPQLKCMPANPAAPGNDGWCTVDTDCKCYAQGARCNGIYCTFTVPPAGGTGGAAGGSGGGSATGGSGGGSATGGSPGASGGAAGQATTSDNGGGGCNVAGSTPAAPLALGAIGAALAVVLSRRRRAPAR
jgi:MYXO-CTERM domain-containing protein